jgi:ribosomal protein S18 acetylase RimI-like enzyme
MGVTITQMTDDHLSQVLQVWDRAFVGRTHDFQIDRAGFTERVLNRPCYKPEGCLVALDGSDPVGLAIVAAPDEGDEGFLSAVLVDPEYQARGIGTKLLEAAETFLSACGKTEVKIGYRGNPISFCIGVDLSTPAHRFLLNRGYRNRGSASLFMTNSLEDFELSDEIRAYTRENATQGVQFGLCEEAHRAALCRFMEEQFPGGWEQSVKGVLEGDPPYSVLVATDGPDVVGFTGPIRVSSSGRTSFTGIGTRPDYRRRKIGMVLFHLLCSEFRSRGGTSSTLHTGLRNPAQEIYFSAGYRVQYLVDYSLEKRLG